MSKAFTKEDDSSDDIDEGVEDENDPLLSQGQKNYITPRGFQRLQEEYGQLKNVERPKVVEVVSWAAGNGDRSENGDYIYGKRRLREIDKRLRFLLKRMTAAEAVDPTLQTQKDKVFFGATVTIEDEEGVQKTYSIVGIDEVDVKNGRISWISPLGKALLQANLGDVVTLKTNTNEQDIEIVKIEYVELP
jgi:transcription elongation factor GreB